MPARVRFIVYSVGSIAGVMLLLLLQAWSGVAHSFFILLDIRWLAGLDCGEVFLRGRGRYISRSVEKNRVDFHSFIGKSFNFKWTLWHF